MLASTPTLYGRRGCHSEMEVPLLTAAFDAHTAAVRSLKPPPTLTSPLSLTALNHSHTHGPQPQPSLTAFTHGPQPRPSPTALNRSPQPPPFSRPSTAALNHGLHPRPSTAALNHSHTHGPQPQPSLTALPPRLTQCTHSPLHWQRHSDLCIRASWIRALSTPSVPSSHHGVRHLRGLWLAQVRAYFASSPSRAKRFLEVTHPSSLT
jgi:hypothetical protein